MGDYLEQYAAHFRLPIRHDVTVTRVSRLDNEFLVETTSGDLLAEQVVVASGPYQNPWIPAFATELNADITQLHSVEYSDPTQLVGDVLVVGAGQFRGGNRLGVNRLRPSDCHRGATPRTDPF